MASFRNWAASDAKFRTFWRHFPRKNWRKSGRIVWVRKKFNYRRL